MQRLPSTFAIVLFGQLRTFKNDSIGESYRKFLSQFESIDVYIACWNKRGFSANFGTINLAEKSISDQVLTVDEVKTHYRQFEFFNVISVHLYDLEEEMNSWPREYRDIYNTPFDYNYFSSSIPVQFTIQSGSRMISSPEKYQQIYFMRPDTKIIHPLDFSPNVLSLQDNTVYFNTLNDRCIDHGFYMNGPTVSALKDLFDRYTRNMKKCIGSDPYFCRSYDSRDNNHLLAFHLKIRNITLSHRPVAIFQVVYNSATEV